RPDLEARGLRVFETSTASHEGLRPLTFALAELVTAARAAEPAPEPTRQVIRPAPVNDAGFTITRRQTDHVYYLVLGDKPERWVRQTNFANDEAVGYLADRLARLGVEEALFAAGARRPRAWRPAGGEGRFLLAHRCCGTPGRGEADPAGGRARPPDRCRQPGDPGLLRCHRLRPDRAGPDRPATRAVHGPGSGLG